MYRRFRSWVQNDPAGYLVSILMVSWFAMAALIIILAAFGGRYGGLR